MTILAYTAIAGTVGAGGLGDIAVRYGHQRGITSVMWVTVVFLIILVQVVQLIFNWLSRRIDKRLDQPSGAKNPAPSISCPALPIPSDPRRFHRLSLENPASV